MDPEIRPFLVTDDVSQLDGRFGPDTEQPRRHRTIVAVLGGRCVGAGSLTWSARHPDFVGADISVDVTMRRSGLGDRLLRRLEELADRPLMFNTEGAAAARFLTARGYALATESRTRVVSMEALRPWLAAATGRMGAAQVLSPPIMSADVACLYDEIYAVRHRWAGRYTPPADAPWITFCGPIIERTLAVASRDGQLVGVTSLHTGPFTDGAAAFLPPTGVLGVFTSAERKGVLAALLCTTLSTAARQGIESIAFEIDTDYWELEDITREWSSARVIRHRQVWTPGVGS